MSVLFLFIFSPQHQPGQSNPSVVADGTDETPWPVRPAVPAPWLAHPAQTIRNQGSGAQQNVPSTGGTTAPANGSLEPGPTNGERAASDAAVAVTCCNDRLSQSQGPDWVQWPPRATVAGETTAFKTQLAHAAVACRCMSNALVLHGKGFSRPRLDDA